MLSVAPLSLWHCLSQQHTTVLRKKTPIFKKPNVHTFSASKAEKHFITFITNYLVGTVEHSAATETCMDSELKESEYWTSWTKKISLLPLNLLVFLLQNNSGVMKTWIKCKIKICAFCKKKQPFILYLMLKVLMKYNNHSFSW